MTPIVPGLDPDGNASVFVLITLPLKIVEVTQPSHAPSVGTKELVEGANDSDVVDEIASSVVETAGTKTPMVSGEEPDGVAIVDVEVTFPLPP